MMKANKRDQWSYWFPRLYKIFAIQNLNNFWARTFEPLSDKLKKTEHFSKRASEKVVDVIMYDHIEWCDETFHQMKAAPNLNTCT